MLTIAALLVLAQIDPTYVALTAAVAGPLGAYLVAARRFSGRIESSDASELWAESRSIRDWSQTRIEDLSRDVAHLRQRVAALETDKDVLARRNETLTLELDVCRRRVAELEASHG